MAHWSRVQQLVGGASAATLETGKCTYKDETRQHTTTYCCHAANESGTDATFFQVGVRPLGRETLAASACRDGCSFVCVGRGMQELSTVVSVCVVCCLRFKAMRKKVASFFAANEA